MDRTELVFSILFYLAFSFYALVAYYAIYRHAKARVNRLFALLSAAQALWAFCFSMAIKAASYGDCLFWRQASALGWGTTYAITLHFFLVLTEDPKKKRTSPLYLLIYAPAAVCVYVFALSDVIASRQYQLVLMSYGWINMPIRNGWTLFFNTYYSTYVLASMVLVWLWRRRSTGPQVPRQARWMFFSLLAALVTGSLVDVILSARLSGSLPQMGPLVTLMPTAAFLFATKRLSLIPQSQEVRSPILSQQTRYQLYYRLSVFYLSAALLAGANFVFADPQDGGGSSSMAGVALMLFGLSLLLPSFWAIKKELLSHRLTFATMVLTVPVILLGFLPYGGWIVWAFPAILMMATLLFQTPSMLLGVTLASIISQLVIYATAHAGTPLGKPAHLFYRICFYLLTCWMGVFVNRTYINRLEENIRQGEFQQLVAAIASEFLDLRPSNMDAKIHWALETVGRFFRVDRTYIFLKDADKDLIENTHRWRDLDRVSSETALGKLPLEQLTWSIRSMKENRVIRIESLDALPAEAAAEKDYLSQLNVQSLLAVPIDEGGEIVGFLGLDVTGAPATWTDRHVKLLTIVSHLIADAFMRIRAEERIEYLAFYDQLTGLPNRTLFIDRLEQAIRLARRTGKYLGVLFIDLDSFKMVNDTMGHSGGDMALKIVSQALCRRVRASDTVARFGGDEFILLIDNLEHEDDIRRITEDVMALFEAPMAIDGHEFCMTASAGVSVYPFDGEESETLIKHADGAMYTAKAKGKNQYVICTNAMKEIARHNICLSNSLYRVWERGELFLQYQPQVNLQTNRVIGLEALLRWQHPQLGLVPPLDFIHLAEMNGTINDIGHWVLVEAVRQNMTWQHKGLPPVRMAVNLSAIQLANPRFVDQVAGILEESGMDPAYLEMEITESAVMREPGNALTVLGGLKDLGISLSIDDFGVEYSSLNRLKTLPIDRIKIDMQFIQGIEKDPKDQAITKVIIHLAKSLGMSVLAEGVETPNQLAFLNQRICDEAQGFFYHMPMDPQEIEELLRKTA